MNRAILLLGSNAPLGHSFLNGAIEQLSQEGEVEKNSGIYETTNFYLNCILVVKFNNNFDKIYLLSKNIEIFFGRTLHSKLSGVIELDIDILKWNDSILRVDDYNKSYSQLGLFKLGLL